MSETKNADAKRDYRRYIFRKILYIAVLALAVFVSAGVSITLGARDIHFFDVYRILFEHISGVSYETGSPAWWDDYIVWDIRLPRVMVAVVAGIALSVCGTVIQSMVKNPLADPYTTGISSGAVFGVAIAMVLGLTASPSDSGAGVLLNAFIFGMIPAGVIILLSRGKSMSPATIILCGIAMSYLFSAMSTLLMIVSDAETIANIYKWQIGSLEGVTWDTFPLMAAVTAAGTAASLILASKLNILATGDNNAKSLGLNVDGIRTICLIVISLVTASVTCYIGIISFLGLVAPNLTRLVIGSDNKYLVPASMLAGAAILLLADTASRLISTVNVPVGVVMSFVGGPVFLLLIILNKKEVWRRTIRRIKRFITATPGRKFCSA